MKIIYNLIVLLFLIFFSVVVRAQTPCNEFIKTYTIIQDACNPRIVHFSNRDTTASSVSWNFGDGSTGTTNEISHEYKNYGEYEVTMIVQFPNGCTGKISKKVPVFLLYDDDLISTESQTICPGQTIQLKTNSSQNEFCWLTDEGGLNIAERNPFVKPVATTKYRFQTKYAGNNLVINSGFEKGNSGFTSEYEYKPVTDSLEKQYAIITNSRDWHGGFESCSDHTPGGGNLMVVNGSPEPNAVVWSQNVSVIPNTSYEFSLWIASVNNAYPAKLKFQINGVILDEKVNVGSGACEWNKFSSLWNSEGATKAKISIINVNTSVAGNDFALDDITFFPYNISYDEITIRVAPEIEIKVDDDKIICKGDSIQLRATGGLTYSWLPMDGVSDSKAGNPFFSPNIPTTYTVTGTSEFGCTATAKVTVTPVDKPVINIGKDVTYCEGGTYQIPGKVNNANTISWSPTIGLSDVTIADPFATPQETTTYEITATNGNCSAKDKITIHIAEAIQLNTMKDINICGPGTVELNTTTVSEATYQWAPATGLSDPGIANPLATIKESTNYTVTVSTPLGCKTTAAVTVTIKEKPVINAGEDVTFCEGGWYSIPGVAKNAKHFRWFPSTGLSDATIANPIASPLTTTTYFVSAINGDCISSDTLTINVAPAISIIPVPDSSICIGSSIQLSGTHVQNADYKWTPATGLSNPGIPDPIAQPDKTTMYIFTVTDDFGCEEEDSVLVTVVDYPVITMNNDMMVCQGQTINLQAKAPGVNNFKWWPEEGLSDPQSAATKATIHSSIKYKVTAINPEGCESTDSVTITAAPLPMVKLIKSNDIDCSHGEVQLLASGGERYKWSHGSTQNNIHSPSLIEKPKASTEYLVTAISQDGCEATASVVVVVKGYPIEDFNVPNAFTPNGDGINDCFGLRKANLNNPFQFEIYNRWGNKVFATTNANQCWDGTLNGVALAPDAFVWQIKVRGECGDMYKKGTVVLLR